MERYRTFALRRTAAAMTAFIVLSACGWAQQATGGPSSAQDEAAVLRDLQQQLLDLRNLVEQMRAEGAQSRVEMRELRQELQDTRAFLAPAAVAKNLPPSSASYATGQTAASTSTTPTSTSTSQPIPATLDDRVQKLEESTLLLGSKIDEQYQTKVETAGKYRARLSGIILMNAFRNVGASDNLDLPNIAQPKDPGGPVANLGATLRQSEIGLEVFGPIVAGAKTSANVQLDFAGGFPSIGNGVNFGVARLQTASMRFEWERTSIIAGQDSLFISPLSPTSFASLATPAFAYAGNLWGWIPQIRAEHRFELPHSQTITIQGGVLDSLDWQFPRDPYFRSTTAGEQSGRPAFALRTAWSRPVGEHPLSFAVAGYYGRQNWSWDRYIDSWAGMTDWQIPLARRLSLSGEFYRGRGVGALGAGIARAVVFGGSPYLPTTPIRGVDSAGGWSQLKLQLTPKLELNGVFAEDNAFGSDIRGFAVDADNFVTIQGRNRGELGNVIFRPRSDLILSAEIRRLRSYPVYSTSSVTNQLNLAVGVLF